MEYSQYCLWVFHEGVAKRKNTVIYVVHADSKDGLSKRKINKIKKDKFNVTQLHTLGYFSI